MNVREKALRVGLGISLFLALAAGCAVSGDAAGTARSSASTDDSGDDTELPDDGVFPMPGADRDGDPVHESKVDTPLGELAFQYKMVDGDAVAEGDMILPIVVPGEIRSATTVGRHWPRGKVPYVIDANLPSSERVTAAIAHWEEKTHVRFVPRTKERDYLHFRAASGCSSNVGQVGGRQFVNLTTSEAASTVVAVGVDRSVEPQRVYFFYKRGFATAGSLTKVNALSNHFRYIPAPGKGVANVVDVAYASDGHLFAFYDDGSVSEGTHEDFSLYGPARPYVLADGKAPADVAGVAIDARDRAHAFYRDGTFSVGTVADLAATAGPKPFTVAPGRTAADLAHVDVAKDGTFVAYYNETQAPPDGGAPTIRALHVSTGTSDELAQASSTAKVSFPGTCTTGSTIHEIGHAVGLFHEQTRHDRDQFVKIAWENITPANRFNFAKHSRVIGSDTGVYDFGSIMHYGPKAFSSNGKETIVPLDGSQFTEQRSGLSPLDIAGVASMYP